MLDTLQRSKKFFLVCLIFLVLLTACGNTDVKTSKASLPPAESNIDTSLKAPNWVEKSPIQQSPNFTEDKKVQSVVNLIATGDNLYHDAVIKDGKQKDGSYDYNYIYENIKKAVKSSDLAIVNQETPIAGNNLKVQGYPTFNTPEEVGQSLVDTGFNIVTQATNHAMDMGIKGVANTREYWKKYPDVIPVGINESQNERNEIKTITKNGIRFALLNYTYGTNGIKIPADKSWALNLIDKKAIQNDVEKAKSSSDMVIVMVHWGVEYTSTPSKQQKEVAQYLTDLGVDVVIGNHPHVIQPIEWKKNKDGHETLIYYSLGNLISAQEKLETLVGGLSYVQFVKYEDKTFGIRQAAIVPTVTDYADGKKQFKIQFLKDYSDENSKKHGIKKFVGPVSLKDFKEIPRDVLGNWYKD
ncbi:CapA family protein [Bacillus thuringiensis]|uniref:CapA family protein n=1 Tax=Bacillus thuringiensis TaxID=1428 RepID=UPI000BED881C|nr:CapA family protein [Bacillus thuringiensis]MEE3960996.1 CapA family protein [Bacillus thuringiensis]PEB69736.1 capsular biosynthesis protein [Bacillus thuringiensis]PFD32743.1 capsular biosynthesis protein [Bacillus thuringiensis]PGF19999.1 capsular biosynthesis protein [Bacillus thuringiensis]RFB61158.1 CapA family protein [Bacillus thuringiensis]